MELHRPIGIWCDYFKKMGVLNRVLLLSTPKFYADTAADIAGSGEKFREHNDDVVICLYCITVCTRHATVCTL